MIKHGVVVNRLGLLNTPVRPRKKTQEQEQKQQPKQDYPPVVVVEQEIEAPQEVILVVEEPVVEIKEEPKDKFDEKKRKKRFTEAFELDQESPPLSSLAPPPEPRSFEQSQKPKYTTDSVGSWKKRT